jgi:hypothetical protein
VQRDVDLPRNLECSTSCPREVFNFVLHSRNHQRVILVLSKQAVSISLVPHRNLRNVTLD